MQSAPPAVPRRPDSPLRIISAPPIAAKGLNTNTAAYRGKYLLIRPMRAQLASIQFLQSLFSRRIGLLRRPKLCNAGRYD